MTIVTVSYPANDAFNYDHYRSVHVALVEKHWGPHGFTGVTMLRGIAAVDGGPAPCALIALLEFRDRAGFDAALASPGTQPLLADIANFTDGQPTIQINERIE